MKRIAASILVILLVLSTSTACFADFKYTETSKVTGGAMMGAVKVIGVFSKNARQLSQPMDSTVSLKGNRMRREDAQGNAEIYDLDGRRIIRVDTQHKTYSITTFDEMRAAMQEAQRKAAQQSKSKDANVKLTPKLQVTSGKGTKKLLSYTAKEMKMRMDMEMQSQDPKHQGETATMWFTSDAWIAPVRGYEELKRFNLRLAKELDWLPGAVLGANPRISPAMVEFQKDTANLTGLPLQQFVSFGGAGTGQPSSGQANNQDSGSSNPITKGIGGLFGKKKKQQDDAKQPDSNSAPTSPANSLMDMTIEVTSIATDALDSSLFQIPEGYKQVKAK
ncbi:MAG TPA: hypothetical protein VNV88_05530 [Candidatus Solibacter sp.]|jgi:hypothetical protein|nr:hypothetical protein [Candidatus Solibacter sp.]